MKLQDKGAGITGGARGVGLAIAERYLAEGARGAVADRHVTGGGGGVDGPAAWPGPRPPAPAATGVCGRGVLGRP